MVLYRHEGRASKRVGDAPGKWAGPYQVFGLILSASYPILRSQRITARPGPCESVSRLVPEPGNLCPPVAAQPQRTSRPHPQANRRWQ